MKHAICCLLGIVLAAPAAMAANPREVVINEVCWAGSGSAAADEWIELHNPTGQDMDLDGWRLSEGGGGALDFAAANCTGGACIIPAGGYFLIEDAEDAVSDIPADVLHTFQGNLSNNCETLTLEDADQGGGVRNLIDFVDCGGAGWYAGTNDPPDNTMERRDPAGAGDAALNWGDNDGLTINGLDSGGQPITGTPRAQNSIYGQTAIAPLIENIHCVDDATVWVFFSTDLEPASAADPNHFWLDFKGGSAPVHPAGAALVGGETAVVELSGIAGFTQGDLLSLVADGLVSTTGGVAAGESADFYAGVVNIDFARADGDGDRRPDMLALTPLPFFTVRGLVNAVGVFNYREASMQDGSGGITIYDTSSLVVDALVRGDEIRISGQMDFYQGKAEIVSVRAAALSTGNPIPMALVTLDDFMSAPESYEGMLLGVQAVSVTGGTWPAANEFQELDITDPSAAVSTLFIDEDTDIDGSAEPDWPIDVRGIGGQYDDDADGDGIWDQGYQLMPRDTDDLGTASGFCQNEGENRSCYTGPSGTENNPPCAPGDQTCSDGWWGPCQNQQLPLAATDNDCNNVDDDCDGAIDDDLDLTTNPENCGSCGNDCTDDYPQAQGVCADSLCEQGPCYSGYGDCTADPGCETSLDQDAFCGACDVDCAALPSVVSAACADDGAGTFGCLISACAPATADCDGLAPNGCEASLTAPETCGSCALDCTALPGVASTTCGDDGTGALVCGISACVPGAGDCDALATNGCEDGLNSTAHCGDCQTACAGDETCVDNGGGYACAAGCPDLDGDGFAGAPCGPDCADDDLAVYPDAPERCDDTDNDCDGETDEDFADKGDACDSPSDPDACPNGTWACLADGTGLVCAGDSIRTEACDGLDNDCDGETDEDFLDDGLGEPCDGLDEDKCARGSKVCNQAGNGVVCYEDADQNMVEDCNGLDDDCDGETDEGFGSYSCGVGVCEVVVQKCVDGEFQECVRRQPTEENREETCDDGLDNDCDGFTDDVDQDCSRPNGGGGCGCAAANEPGGPANLLLLGLMALAWRRRRTS